MYPGNGLAAVDLTAFPSCQGVADLIYNPARTALLLQAERLGIPSAGGLWMLVAQAQRAAELFTGTDIPESVIPKITASLRREMENVVLVGMPGSGKTTIAMALAEKLGRPVLDVDAAVVETAGCSIPTVFEREGEGGFRRRETAAIADLGKRSGVVIATGGGSVTPAGELRPPPPERHHLLAPAGLAEAPHRRPPHLPDPGPLGAPP